jgi:hypothetical protein
MTLHTSADQTPQRPLDTRETALKYGLLAVNPPDFPDSYESNRQNLMPNQQQHAARRINCIYTELYNDNNIVNLDAPLSLISLL